MCCITALSSLAGYHLKITVLVRGRLLVVSVDVALVVHQVPALVVRVVLPVAVLHHLALGQVRTPFNELGKPGDKPGKCFVKMILSLVF